jgi:hypothetical protein
VCDADNLIEGQTEEDEKRRRLEEGCGGYWKREVHGSRPRVRAYLRTHAAHVLKVAVGCCTQIMHIHRK